MIRNLQLVKGESVANRARYWVYERLRQSGVPSADIEWRGVSRKTVYNFVTAGRSVQIEKLGAIADTLNCDVVDLFKPLPGEFAKPKRK